MIYTWSHDFEFVPTVVMFYHNHKSFHTNGLSVVFFTHAYIPWHKAIRVPWSVIRWGRFYHPTYSRVNCLFEKICSESLNYSINGSSSNSNNRSSNTNTVINMVTIPLDYFIISVLPNFQINTFTANIWHVAWYLKISYFVLYYLDYHHNLLVLELSTSFLE